MKSRRSVHLAAAAVVALGLGACSSSAKKTDNPTSTTVSIPAGPATTVVPAGSRVGDPCALIGDDDAADVLGAKTGTKVTREVRTINHGQACVRGFSEGDTSRTLIVAVQNGSLIFDAAKGILANQKPIAGMGDGAYVADVPDGRTVSFKKGDRTYSGTLAFVGPFKEQVQAAAERLQAVMAEAAKKV